ncbi:hypothetical protein BPMI_00564 [Candidatus Burkholderia pumila]|uniref:Uncharacterized protein n=1 Tax=Candidatus Burkholderia pumila TaxID=1090375 RepID=A0ABR5HKC1_9BURK|nr:hypothetical protein BPMI_00564 [Candidatus Burkholderia pumila]
MMTDLSRGPLQTEVSVQAMLLTDPKQASIDIPELCTQDVGTGRFRIPPSMDFDGSWLIYPAFGSADSVPAVRPCRGVHRAGRTGARDPLAACGRAYLSPGQAVVCDCRADR